MMLSIMNVQVRAEQSPWQGTGIMSARCCLQDKVGSRHSGSAALIQIENHTIGIATNTLQEASLTRLGQHVA